MNVQFLPHTIPSYAAQTNFKIVQKKLPEYAYESRPQSTNVNDRAVDWEAEIINDFRGNPNRTERMVIRDTPVGQFLTLARPLKVGLGGLPGLPQHARSGARDNGGALRTAERVRLETGETVAAQVVSIPLAVPLQRAYDSLLLLVAGLVGVFLLMLVIVNVLLRILVVKPVIGISDMATEVSMGKLDAPEYVHRSDDEIGSLATSFNRMRRSLQNAMKMLDEQA